MKLRTKGLIGLVVVLLMVASLIGVALPKAEFQITNLVIEPREVLVGEPVVVSVDIRNTGRATGEYQATLMVNGDVHETRNLKVPAKGTESVSFTVTPTSPGEFKVTLAGLTASFLAKEGLLPVLYPGDWWRYKGSTGEEESEVTYEVLGETTIKGVVTYVVQFSGKLPAQAFDRGTSFLDKGTLYPVEEERSGKVDNVTISEKLTVASRNIQGSPWPLVVGKEWGVSWGENFTSRVGLVVTKGERQFSRTFKVEGKEEVTTATGVFRCFRVVERDETGNVTGRWWYSDKVKREVRCELMVQGVSVTYELLSYQASTTPPTPPQPKLDIRTPTEYEEPTFGYTISYPEGWELATEEGEEGAVYIFTSTGAKGLRFAWLSVKVISLPSETSLDEQYEKIVAATEESDVNFELVSSVKVPAELPWYQLEWSSSLKEVKRKGKTIIALKGEQLFMVTGWVQEAYSTEYWSALNKVIQSFGIRS